MKTLTITEAEAKMVLRLAEKISAGDLKVTDTSASTAVEVAKTEPLVQVELPSAKRTAKAVRKAQNQATMRSINGHLASATVFHQQGDAGSCLQQLRSAMALVPENWNGVAMQVVRKADEFGLEI